jgi:16S rRNA (cytosine1402-N4)-methyltransferase
MRLDRNSYISAYDLVNNLNEDEISNLLWSFGQERWHNRIARRVVEERQKHPITTTAELSEIVMRAIPPRFRRFHYRIHPATRTFQAVRIAVNRELEALEQVLARTIPLVAPAGRICVISFHSLEDRVVKWAFRKAAADGVVKILTPKPLTPTESEARANPSSRSSKFRAVEKI